jgi:hypothetical protein
MICDIARNVDESKLAEIQGLEHDLGMTLVAFSCRELDPAREERLRKIMEQLGPVLQAPPAEPDDGQLSQIRQTEKTLGLLLVAVAS